jgi:hypothetical protein
MTGGCSPRSARELIASLPAMKQAESSIPSIPRVRSGRISTFAPLRKSRSITDADKTAANLD